MKEEGEKLQATIKATLITLGVMCNLLSIEKLLSSIGDHSPHFDSVWGVNYFLRRTLLRVP